VADPDGFDAELSEEDLLSVEDNTVAGLAMGDLREQIWNTINATAIELVKLLDRHGLSNEELSGYVQAITLLEEQESASETEIAVLKDRLDETDTRWRERTGPLRDALLSLRQARSRLAEDETTNHVILDNLDQQIGDLEERLGLANDELEELQQEIEKYLQARKDELEALQRKLGENQLIILQLLRFLKRPDHSSEVLELYRVLEDMLRNVQPEEPV